MPGCGEGLWRREEEERKPKQSRFREQASSYGSRSPFESVRLAEVATHEDGLSARKLSGHSGARATSLHGQQQGVMELTPSVLDAGFG